MISKNNPILIYIIIRYLKIFSNMLFSNDLNIYWTNSTKGKQ